jgi:hypothetical protein
MLCPDLQTVNIKLRVLFKPRIEKLPQLYRDLGLDYNDRVLHSIVNETLKAVVVRDACQCIAMPASLRWFFSFIYCARYTMLVCLTLAFPWYFVGFVGSS